MSSYPWSESGLQLLSTIQAYIEENGGRTELLKAVLAENQTNTDTCPESYTKKRMLLAEIYGNVPRKNISSIIGLGEASTAVMINELLECGMIKKAYMGRNGRMYTDKVRQMQDGLIRVEGRKRRVRVKPESKRLTVKREQFQPSFD